MTGRRNRAQAPRGSSPRAPLLPWLFIWIKKWDSEIFLLQRIAARFSANIIWLLFYLFAKSPRLRGVVNAAASRRPLRGCTNFFEASGYAQTKKTYFFESSLPTFFQESRREVF